MRANRAYRLIVTRGGRAPALLADAGRVDHIEVVEIDGGEVVLFWDRPPQAPRAGARAARRPGAAGGARSSSRAGVPWKLMARRLPEPRYRARVARDDDAHPPLRGARGRDVRAGQGRRLPAPVDRRGGDDRRQRARAARAGLPDLHLPLPRPRAGARHAARERDGRAVRARRRLLARARRLDAHVRLARRFMGGYGIVGGNLPIAAGHRARERLRAAPTRSRCARSATAPPTRARSARR